MEESLYLQRACYLAVSSLGADKAVRHLVCSTAEELEQKLLSDKLPMSAYFGYAEDVKSIFAQGFNGPKCSILGSPLCAAAAGNHREIVAFLLGQGISPNSHRKDGPTALWLSCLNGHHEVVQLLLLTPTIKMNIRHRNKTPLAVAAEKGHAGIMRMLLARHDVDLDFEGVRSPLMCATMGDQASAIHLLVDKLEFPSRDAVEYYNLLLWGAVDQNKVSAVHALLQYPQIDPNWEGWPSDEEQVVESLPLWNAVSSGNHEIVYELLQRPDIAVQQEGFDSVLLVAIRQPNEKVVEILLDCKAVDPNAESLLVLAVKKADVHVVELFLRRPDTDFNLFDLSGDSALSFAGEYGDEEILRLLLGRADLDLKQKDNQGQTAIWLAAAQGHEKIVRHLLERDRSVVNMPESKDITPLMAAASYGDLAVVKVLLAFGANFTLEDWQGRTALSLAKETGFASITERLLACQEE